MSTVNNRFQCNQHDDDGDDDEAKSALLFKLLLLQIVFECSRLCGSNQHISGSMRITLPGQGWILLNPTL